MIEARSITESHLKVTELFIRSGRTAGTPDLVCHDVATRGLISCRCARNGTPQAMPFIVTSRKKGSYSKRWRVAAMKIISIVSVYKKSSSTRIDFGSLDQKAGSPRRKPKTIIAEYGVKRTAYLKLAAFCGSGERKRTAFIAANRRNRIGCCLIHFTAMLMSKSDRPFSVNPSRFGICGACSKFSLQKPPW